MVRKKDWWEEPQTTTASAGASASDILSAFRNRWVTNGRPSAEPSAEEIIKQDISNISLGQSMSMAVEGKEDNVDGVETKEDNADGVETENITSRDRDRAEEVAKNSIVQEQNSLTSRTSFFPLHPLLCNTEDEKVQETGTTDEKHNDVPKDEKIQSANEKAEVAETQQEKVPETQQAVKEDCLSNQKDDAEDQNAMATPGGVQKTETEAQPEGPSAPAEGPSALPEGPSAAPEGPSAPPTTENQDCDTKNKEEKKKKKKLKRVKKKLKKLKKKKLKSSSSSSCSESQTKVEVKEEQPKVKPKFFSLFPDAPDSKASKADSDEWSRIGRKLGKQTADGNRTETSQLGDFDACLEVDLSSASGGGELKLGVRPEEKHQWDTAMSSVTTRELKRKGFNADMDLSSTGYVGQANAWQQYQQWATWAAWQQKNEEWSRSRSRSRPKRERNRSRSYSRSRSKSPRGLDLKSREEVERRRKDNVRKGAAVGGAAVKDEPHDSDESYEYEEEESEEEPPPPPSVVRKYNRERDIPPGFAQVSSSSRPGSVSYRDLQSGKKFATLLQAWEIYDSR